MVDKAQRWELTEGSSVEATMRGQFVDHKDHSAAIERRDGLLLWALYHHQGGSSPVGQPIRRALGIGEHADLTPEQIARAKKAAEELKP